jgi:uncharacterized protein (DUF362 family)
MNIFQDSDNQMDRRNFIKRVAKTGASVAVAASLGYLFYDAKGPGGTIDLPTVTVPDFSMPHMGKKMAIVRGKDRKDTITKAFAAMGGIESFIKRDDRVVLKVNAAFATPPMLSATTHPELIKRVIELCFAAGAAQVIVTDNPINDPGTCFKLTGIQGATVSSGGKLVLPKKSYFQPTTVNGGTLITEWPLLFTPFKKATKLIGMAPVKNHQRSGASMTMKNWYGLLGGRRNTFHQDIHNTIKELALMVKPTLVILDGTTTMMTNGPTGGALSDLKNTNTMIVSTDQVAADAFGASLLDKTPADLPHILKAENAGVGTADYTSLNPVII